MSAARAFAETNRSRSGWTPTAAHERQAQSIAAARNVPTGGRGTGIRSEEAPGVTGAGRPLPSLERTRMEHRFGRDFSGVRVHTGSGAANALGAKAFAYGKDIVFGPGQYEPQSKAGGELLTHELAHIAQQADQGAAAIQKQPKNDKGPQGGIGSSPPSEPFIKATEVALEDASVLFGFDKAGLTADSRKAITEAIGKHKGPVTVEIDGYASSEGQGPSMAEYNLNLSAHRAAAVKAFLVGKLPAGSKFTLVAHGETSDFVPLEQNRRAGFTIRDGVEAPADAQKKMEDGAGKDKPGKDDTAPRTIPPLVLDPKSTADRYSGPSSPLAPYRPAPSGPYLIPPLPSLGNMDWLPLQDKAAAHAYRIDDSMANSLTLHHASVYQTYLPFLGPKYALKFSDFATNYVFDKFLSRENPNTIDIFDLQFQQAFPKEVHLVLPIFEHKF